MDNLEKIKIIIREILKKTAPDSEVVLFGSRAKGKAHSGSDYDFIIIVSDDIQPFTRKKIGSAIRKELANNYIDADIIIQTKSKYNELRDFPGNVSHWASTEGIAI